MQQLVFVTVFLGLIAGTQPVELVAPADAARVEVRLDGQTVATLTRPPWKTSVDFGDGLLPHRLEAVALDASGVVLGTAVQKVNAATEAKELQLALDGSRARILWSHLDVAKPEAIRATIDGKRVEVGSDLTIDLPRGGDERVHLLEVSVRTAQLERDAQLVFGPIFTDASSAALTAVPVRLRAKSARLGDVSVFAGERALRAVALEDLPAQVIVIRDPSPEEASTRLKQFARDRESAGIVQGWSQRRGGQSTGTTEASGPVGTEFDSGFALALSDQVRFLWPVGRAGKGELKSMLFYPSPWFSAGDRVDLRGLLTGLAVGLSSNEKRYADAVAVAVLQAAQSQRPRAVVLIAGAEMNDKSRLTPAAVRAYADRLGVPLLVWSLAPNPPSEWGPATKIDAPQALRKAVHALRQELDAQRVLWVEGDWLPHEVAVKGTAVEPLAR